MKIQTRISSLVLGTLAFIATLSVHNAALSAAQAATPAPTASASFDIGQLPVISASNVAQLKTVGQYAIRGEIKNISTSLGNGQFVVSGTLGAWVATTSNGYFNLILSTDSLTTSAAISSPFGVAAVGSANGSIQVVYLTNSRRTVTQGKLLTGHIGAVNTLAISPDGQTVASGGADSTVRLWSVSPNISVNISLTSHTSAVTSIAFSPDGKTLASASVDKTVKLWSLSTGQVAFTLTGHTDTVTSVAFSRDGKTVASASADRTVRLWDATSGQLLLTLAGSPAGLTTVAFSLDGKTVLAPAQDGTVQRWQVSDRTALPPLVGQGQPLLGIVLENDGSLLSANQTGQLYYWKAASNPAVPATFYGQSLGGRFVQDSKSMAISNGSTTIIWSLATGKPTTTYQSSGLVFSPDLKFTAARDNNNHIHLTNLTNGQETDLGSTSTLGVNLAFSPDSKILAYELTQGVGVLWDTSTGKVLAQLSGHTNYLTYLAFSPDGKQLAAGDQNGTILLTDVATQQIIATIASKGPFPGFMSFSTDGKTVGYITRTNIVDSKGIYTGYKSVLNLWNVASQQPVGTIDQVNNFAYSPDGQLIAAIPGNGTLALFRASDRSLIQTVPDPSSKDYTIFFSPDGKMIETEDGYSISLWAVSTGTLAKINPAPTATLTPVATAAVATSIPTAAPTAANSTPQPVSYETPAHGELTTSTEQQSFILIGAKDDVVEALLTAVSPKGSTRAFIPEMKVTNLAGDAIMDSSQGAGGSHGVQDQAGNTTYYSTYFFALQQNGPDTISVIAPAQSSGTFTVLLHHIPLLTLDTPVSGQIDYKMLAAGTPTVLYALKHNGPISLDYQTIGLLNVTVEISQIQVGGNMMSIGLLGNPSPDSFAPKTNAGFNGGTLHVTGAGSLYIVSLGNGIKGFDDPQSFFNDRKDTDTAHYQLAVHAFSPETPSTAATTAASVPSATLTPAPSMTPTPTTKPTSTVAATSAPTIAATLAAPASALVLPTLPAATAGATIQIWLVGDPSGSTPTKKLSSTFTSRLAKLGLKANISIYTAAQFPQSFMTAIQNNTLPDIVAGGNYLPFQTVLQNPAAGARLLVLDRSLQPLDNGFSWAVKNSPNYRDVLALLLQLPDCTPDWLTRPSLSTDDLTASSDLAEQSLIAFMNTDSKTLASLAEPNWLAPGLPSVTKAQFYTIRACAFWGNNQLLFIPVVGSYLGTNGVGPITALVVLHKVNGTWRLLTVTNDTLLLRPPTLANLETLGRSLKAVPTGAPIAPAPAQLISPADGQTSVPLSGQRFGSYAWTASLSSTLAGEIAEFDYGYATRLFVIMPGQPTTVSDGQLFTTQLAWHWRVWSIDSDGGIAFSETRSMTH